MRYFVTGAAGFIGSNLVDRLLKEGHEVIGWDNFSTGQQTFLDAASKQANFRLVRGDNLDLQGLTQAMAGSEFVFHLAANADVRFGLDHPRKDLEQNTFATFNVLEAMRANGVKGIAFSSTGSVYGEANVIPTPEDVGFPIQTSLYAASKVAGETLIQAYCEGYGFEGYIFRFVSILGERYTHGHVFDFYRQLLDHPDYLKVLGDGNQRKSYLYVQDCLDAMLHTISVSSKSEAHAAAELPLSPSDGERAGRGENVSVKAHSAADLCAGKQAKDRVHIYNLGTAEYCQVKDSIGWICVHLGLKPRLEFSGGNRGWVGDNPFIFLDTKKIQATGWKPRLTIQQGIIQTLDWLKENQWVLNRQ